MYSHHTRIDDERKLIFKLDKDLICCCHPIRPAQLNNPVGRGSSSPTPLTCVIVPESSSPGDGPVVLGELDETDLKGQRADSQNVYHLEVREPHLWTQGANKGTVCDSGKRLLIFKLNSQSYYTPSLCAPEATC